MERDCNTCKYSECWEYADPCLSCAGGNKWQCYTNADKIRAMMDEELAKWKVKDCPPGEAPTESCFYAESGGDPTVCRLCWLDWLRQEAET